MSFKTTTIPYKLYRIVESDNYGSDYPDEKFATPYTFFRYQAEVIAKCFNEAMNPTGQGRRYWKVVEDGYKLQPGFEP